MNHMHVSKKRNGVVRRRAGLCFFSISIASVILSSGCAQPLNLEPVPPLTRRVAVLDFAVPDDMVKTNFQVQGWWFGARSIFQNPNSGELFADALSRHLVGLDYIEQHSRRDIKYFMSQKRGLLMDKFKDLQDSDYAKMLGRVSPLDYGEKLGVDEVLCGRIIEAYLSEHRTFHTWHGYLKVEVDLWDMETGRVVWTKVFEEKKYFSYNEVMSLVAAQVVGNIDASHYRRSDASGAR